MPSDIVLTVAAIVVFFAAFALTLAWGDAQTREIRPGTGKLE